MGGLVSPMKRTSPALDLRSGRRLTCLEELQGQREIEAFPSGQLRRLQAQHLQIHRAH